MKIINLTAIAMTFAVIASTSAQASFIILSDRATFESFLAGQVIIEDRFDNDIDPVPGSPFTFDSGVISEGSVIDLEDGFIVEAGAFSGVVSLDNFGEPDTPGNSITWTFPFEINAFAFDFFDAYQFGVQVLFDEGSGLQATTLYDLAACCASETSGFAGFIARGTFSEITFLYPDDQLTPGFDIFSIDNLAFAAAPSEVPLPAALPFFLAGLGGVGFLGRRQKKPVK